MFFSSMNFNYTWPTIAKSWTHGAACRHNITLSQQSVTQGILCMTQTPHSPIPKKPFAGGFLVNCGVLHYTHFGVDSHH